MAPRTPIGRLAFPGAGASHRSILHTFTLDSSRLDYNAPLGASDVRRWQQSKHWGRSRHHTGRANAFTRMPIYARIAIPLLLILLIGRLAWQSVHSIRRVSHPQPAVYSDSTLAAAVPVAPWQRDFSDSLAESLQAAAAGNLTAAEVAVDRSESILTAARLQSFTADRSFFSGANAALDTVIAKTQNERLFDHVTQARVSLAELRSSLNEPAGDVTGPVRIDAPRTIAANETFNPHALGGNYLDATLMPDTAEILLPPAATRSLKEGLPGPRQGEPGSSDGVRVENITIAGAAQTLDGIRWRNVTFVGTRLRYEDGDLDLENVRFVRCRFGIPSDDRGARLASALALGQSSITIQ